MTASHAVLPVHGCDHVLRISTIESPLITELVAALSHLESAAAVAGTPAALELPSGKTVTTEQMSDWVAMNSSRIRTLLETIANSHPDQQGRPAA